MTSYIATTWYRIGGTIAATDADTGQPTTLAVSRNDNGHLCLTLPDGRYELHPDAVTHLAAVINRAVAVNGGRPADLNQLPRRTPNAHLNPNGTATDWFTATVTHRQVTT